MLFKKKILSTKEVKLNSKEDREKRETKTTDNKQNKNQLMTVRKNKN